MHQDVNVANLVGLVEQSTNINAYTVDDIHLWGLFRAAMYFPLVAAFRPERQPEELRRRLAAAFASVAAARGLPHESPVAAATGRIVSPNAGPVVVVASGPTHHVVTNGLHISPIADRWIEALRRGGVPTLKLDVEPSWITERQPRRVPSVAFGPVSDAERQSASRRIADRWLPSLRAMFDDAGQVLRQRVGLSIDAVLGSTAEAAMHFVAGRDAAERWLDAVQPRAVLFICYYETNYLPLIAACRARGIPTADLQHGVNGTVHAAYTHWTVLPDSGYGVLPEWFVTWGENSTDNLRRWWPTSAHPHRVVVGGRADLDPGAAMPETPAHRAIADAAARAGARVLVTTQDELLSAALLAEMQRAPSDWCWFVRPHPQAERLGPATAPQLRAQLDAAGIGNALVVPTGGVTLGDLLRHVEFHVTSSSSSWMEAWAYGVPTVFTDPGADGIYGLEIARGYARHAPYGEGVAEMIRADREARAVSRVARGREVIDTSPDAMSRALTQVVPGWSD